MINESPRNLSSSSFLSLHISDDNTALAEIPSVPAPSGPGPVPYPTLYSGSGPGQERNPKMGAIEVLLYNMASMLASVAAGYDVRLSNVSPIHPKLHPNR